MVPLNLFHSPHWLLAYPDTAQTMGKSSYEFINMNDLFLSFLFERSLPLVTFIAKSLGQPGHAFGFLSHYIYKWDMRHKMHLIPLDEF